jgi:uncharacterized membrane protein YhaH (DUF805 family)
MAITLYVMTFGKAFSNYFSKYFNYEDRASRAEFWFPQIVMFPLGMVFTLIQMFCPGILSLIVMLLSFGLITLPNISLLVRRMHDFDKSGWWVLLEFILIVGFIIIFVFCCMKGTEGANRFGPQGE